jgi:hypothetical protein
MHPRPDSARKRLQELAENTHQEVERLEDRRGRLVRELATIDVKLIALRAELKGTLDRLYGLAGVGGASREIRAADSSAHTETRAAAQGPRPNTPEEVSSGDAETWAAEPHAASSIVEAPSAGDTPRGIFELPTDQWTDLQLAWMVMTPTVLKTWRGVCAIRGVINRLGGSALKKDIVADLHERGHAYTVDQIGDLLGSTYFMLGPDHLWRAVDTGPVLTPTRRKIAERWLAIIKLIERHGGRARWKLLYDGLFEMLGAEATRNRVNHALREGPFSQDKEGWYRFAPSLIKFEEPEPD